MLTLKTNIWEAAVSNGATTTRRMRQATVRIDRIRVSRPGNYQARLSHPAVDAPHDNRDGNGEVWVYFTKKDTPGIPVLQPGWTLYV